MLLRNRKAYTPIPQKYVYGFVKKVIELLASLAEYGIHLGTTSISASVLGDRRLVFWDFFPARMRDATGLLPTAPALNRPMIYRRSGH